MSHVTELLDDPADRRRDPGRRARLLVLQTFFTVVAVACLAIEWTQHDGTPWLIVTAIALLCLALALSAGSYFKQQI